MNDSASRTGHPSLEDELLAVDAEVVASIDGVAVVELSARPTGSVERSVAFRLVSGLPDAVALGDVSLREGRETGRWRARPDDHALQFEGVVAPDETRSTRYAVDLPDGRDPDAAVAGVEVEVAWPAPEGAAGGDEPLFRSAAGRPIEDATGASAPEAETVTAVDETMFERSTAGDDGAAGENSPGGTEGEESRGATPDGDATAETIDDAPVGAPDRGDSDTERRAAVRSSLDSERSVRVHLRHLQGRVEEVLAYADALEEFIDEEGTAADVLGELRTDLESLAGRQRTLESDLETTDERVEEAHRSVADVEETVSDLESGVGSVRADVDDLAAEVADLRAELAEVAERHEEDLSAFEDEVFHLQDVYEQDVDQLETVLRGRIAEVEEALEADIERVEAKHDDDVEELKSLIDSSVDRLEDRQADIEEDVAELDAWRTSFVSAIDEARPDRD